MNGAKNVKEPEKTIMTGFVLYLQRAGLVFIGGFRKQIDLRVKQNESKQFTATR